MAKKSQNSIIFESRNQLTLYGYENYFSSFIKLHKKNILPNTILLNGPKGSGKATFAYHFIYYLLTLNESDKYSLNSMSINIDNKVYQSIYNGTNPNFMSLDNNLLNESVKIENVRNLLKYLGKSTYSSGYKFILIDNADYLNLHSANALLKVLEESKENTYFFLIHHNTTNILNTIKSRCIEFKIFFTLSEKKKILENIIKQHSDEINFSDVPDSFYFDTPGNILNYLTLLQDSNIDFSKDKISTILFMIDKYKNTNDVKMLKIISFFIELFYSDLSNKKLENLNFYDANKFKLLNKINDTKNFNLDKNVLFSSLTKTLQNDAK